MDLIRALGADGARGGWAVAGLIADGSTRLFVAGALEELASPPAPVAIDVPIGLREDLSPRTCDALARQRLGPRRFSVFPAPARWMLPLAGDYTAIRAGCIERGESRSFSAQGAGIVRKVAEVDAFVHAVPSSEEWLFECHPELAFARLNGGAPLAHPKTTPDGVAERLRLVRARFDDADRQLAAFRPLRSVADVTDALDAYAALATAARADRETLGGERDAHGIPMRIVV